MCCWGEEEPTANHRALHTLGPIPPGGGSLTARCPIILTGTPHCPSHPLLPDQSTSQLGPCLIWTERGKPFLFLVSSSPSLAHSGICLRPNGHCFLSHLSCPPFPSSNSCFSKRPRPPRPYIQLLEFSHQPGQVVALLCLRLSLAPISLSLTSLT